jgi:hypothetical protein
MRRSESSAILSLPPAFAGVFLSHSRLIFTAHVLAFLNLIKSIRQNLHILAIFFQTAREYYWRDPSREFPNSRQWRIHRFSIEKAAIVLSSLLDYLA